VELKHEDVCRIVIHHTGVDVGARSEDEYLRDLDTSVRVHRRMDGIPYHVLILPSGEDSVCRPLDQRGQHARGWNYRSIGVALAGNLEHHPPTGPAVATLVSICVGLCEEFGLTADDVVGHKELEGCRTDCPGSYVPLQILRRKIRRELDCRNKLTASLPGSSASAPSETTPGGGSSGSGA
jgi:N-acetylmuramoyl-L-alanine amidase